METAVALQPGLFEKFERAVVARLEVEIQEWSRLRKLVLDWEDANLLDNPNPSPALLEEHRKQIDWMTRYGQWFNLVTSHPDFPRADLADLVQSTLWLLREHYLAFHKPMPKEEADRIAAAAFPDEG